MLYATPLFFLKIGVSILSFLNFPVLAPSMSTLPSCDAPLIIRRIRQTKSVAECLELIPKEPTQDVVIAALHLCGKHNDLGSALYLLSLCNVESCLSLTISIAGKCGDYKTALNLLRSSPFPPSIASYHSCLAACAKAKAWKECLDVYELLEPPKRTACTAGIVLTAMAKANRGVEALDLFHSLANPELPHVMKTTSALIGMGDLEGARQLVEDHAPNETMALKLLTSAYSKVGNWEMVRSLNSKSSDTLSFEPWDSLSKIGKGRTAYWKLGTYEDNNGWSLTVALHPHRNPAQNGIKLLLVDKEAKIGYLLMKNDVNTSTLLGLYLDPTQRKRGLSKIFLALWLRLCLHAKLYPNTGIMNKPLLCLSLQHTFGYYPDPKNQGVLVEISSNGAGDGKIILYSSVKKFISGAFSPADVEREGLVFVTEPPKPPGRIISMKTMLLPPENFGERAAKVLDAGQFVYNQTIPLKRILCGK
jgi:hypothetical protein